MVGVDWNSWVRWVLMRQSGFETTVTINHHHFSKLWKKTWVFSWTGRKSSLKVLHIINPTHTRCKTKGWEKLCLSHARKLAVRFRHKPGCRLKEMHIRAELEDVSGTVWDTMTSSLWLSDRAVCSLSESCLLRVSSWTYKKLQQLLPGSRMYIRSQWQGDTAPICIQ